MVVELLKTVCCPSTFAGIRFPIHRPSDHGVFNFHWNRLKAEFMFNQIMTQGYFVPHEWSIDYSLPKQIDLIPVHTGGFHWHIIPIAPELKVDIRLSSIEDLPGSTCKSCHLVVDLLNDIYCLDCFSAFMDYRPLNNRWKGKGVGALLEDVTGIRQAVLEGTQPGQATASEENVRPGQPGMLFMEDDRVPEPEELVLIVGDNRHNRMTFRRAGYTQEETEAYLHQFNETVRDDQQFFDLYRIRTGQTTRFTIQRSAGNIAGQTPTQLIRDDPVEIPGIEVEEIAYVEPVIQRVVNVSENFHFQILEDPMFTDLNQIHLRSGMVIWLRAGEAFKRGDWVRFGHVKNATVYLPTTSLPSRIIIGRVLSDTVEDFPFVNVQICPDINIMLITRPPFVHMNTEETYLLLPGHNEDYQLGQQVTLAGETRIVREIRYERDQTKISLMSLTTYLARIQALESLAVQNLDES